MAKRSVVWTETAKMQRREILKYWTLKTGSTKYAEKLIALIKERIEIISNHPESCKLSEYSQTREAAMGNFSIYYKIFKTEIIITSFWDNRQDPSELLNLLTKPKTI